MDQSRLPCRSLRGAMARFAGVCLVAACLVAMVLVAPASAGPPKIGSSGGGSWSPFGSWKLPSFLKAEPATTKSSSSTVSEPSFVKATRTGITRTWNGVQRSSRSAWESTKYALRPYDPPPQKRQKSSSRQPSSSGGFWSGLFGDGAAPQPEATVNDFLRQPMPQ